MKDFFTFYTDIRNMAVPFTAFSLYHMLFLALAILLITALFSYYRRLDAGKQRRMQVIMAIYFLVEELLYTTWLFLFCHEQVWHQILPLELCSLCVYMNALTVYLKKDTLRFFSGVVGLCAGLIAMVYPANISELYPVLSYRTINFYILHASFVCTHTAAGPYIAAVPLYEKEFSDYLRHVYNSVYYQSESAYAVYVCRNSTEDQLYRKSVSHYGNHDVSADYPAGTVSHSVCSCISIAQSVPCETGYAGVCVTIL